MGRRATAVLALIVLSAAARAAGPAAPQAADTDSALARLAASLKPGTWAMLNKDGDASGYGLKFTESGIGTMYGYASKATYDPVRRRVFFFASGHHNQGTEESYAEMMKFIVYEVDRNRWTRLKTPQWYLDTGTKGGNSHGYQYQTIANGQFFRMSLGPPARKSTVQVCNIDRDRVEDIDPKKDWEESVDVPFTFSVGPLEYFPDRKSLLTINTRSSELYERGLTAPKWTKVASCEGLTGFGIAASYNPVHKVVVFGGGSQAAPPWTNYRKWYQFDAAGKVTPLDDSPVDSYAATSTLFSVDPTSGKHLLIRPNDFDFKKTTGYWFYELDVTQKPGSQWSRRKDLEAAVPEFYSRSPNHVFATVVVPLPEYGVNLFMGPANTWIYKHADKSEPRTLKGHQGSVLAVNFSPDGKTLASASRDKTVKLWDPATGELQRTLTDHTGDVYDVTFSRKGTWMATASGDKTVKLWDTKTWKETRTLDGHTDIVRSVAFAPDQKTLASASVDLTVRLWEVETGKLKQTLEGHTKRVKAVVYSPDGTILASASSDVTIRLWDARTGKLIRTLEGHTGDLEGLAFSPDGKTLASSSHDTTVRLWDVETGKVRHTLEGHQEEVDSVTFSPDGKTVASGCKDTTIKLWDAETGKLRQTLTGPKNRLESLTFSPDGKTLASGSGGPESLVWLWPVGKPPK